MSPEQPQTPTPTATKKRGRPPGSGYAHRIDALERKYADLYIRAVHAEEEIRILRASTGSYYGNGAPIRGGAA